MLEWGTQVNACPNGGTWVNACLNGGGLLQDTVSPMGDMVHFLFSIFLKLVSLTKRIKLSESIVFFH
jgi:hypothetical protein